MFKRDKNDSEALICMKQRAYYLAHRILYAEQQGFGDQSDAKIMMREPADGFDIVYDKYVARENFLQWEGLPVLKDYFILVATALTPKHLSPEHAALYERLRKNHGGIMRDFGNPLEQLIELQGKPTDSLEARR